MMTSLSWDFRISLEDYRDAETKLVQCIQRDVFYKEWENLNARLLVSSKGPSLLACQKGSLAYLPEKLNTKHSQVPT